MTDHEVTLSVNGVPIRLTTERWVHIVENHDYLSGLMDAVLDAVRDPQWVTRGQAGSLIAWAPAGRGRHLAVCYREISKTDGFIITALVTRKPRKEPKVWP